jgi:hypothetical protein
MSFSDLTMLAEDDYERALRECKGIYQEAILGGWEALSGSTLKGKAASYSRHYKASSRNYLDRLSRAGLAVSEQRRERGRRVLVVASPEIVAARKLLSPALL